MKELAAKFNRRYFGRHLDLRARLFNTLAIGGIIISLIMAASTLFTGAGVLHLILNLLIAAVSFGLLYFSRTTGRYQLCYLITGIAVFMLLFPAIFFYSDGYRSGMPAFFVLAVTISVFMLRGRTALIVTSLELLLYVGLCLLVYHHPHLTTPFPSEAARLQDILISLVVVSATQALPCTFTSAPTTNNAWSWNRPERKRWPPAG